MDNVQEWTSYGFMPELFTMPFCRKDWKMISAESSFMPPHPHPHDLIGQGAKLNCIAARS